jgi:(E)-4-hydroxy-3-methylbut-2-enyl-diphosphate synthase
MDLYCASLTAYKRLQTREVQIGDLLLGNPDGGHGHPIRVQTMTTTDTMDTLATVEQSIRCIEAGSELIRITAPSKRDAENLLHIKNELRRRGYKTPIVADIHFTPNAAEIAARIVEKVRVNPGNYVDKKKFETVEYTDAQYSEEIDRIYQRFVPLVKICKEYGTAMRIGTNHGSLSDRIMSRYGDTPMGMVESAMEFLRIARSESFHQVVLSMKSSNPQVMVHAYRLLVKTMFEEFGECYPLHLGVTEAGDGQDGRIKSAVGIGTLLEDGLGDTIRVSLTEDPEFEIPVCKNLVKRYQDGAQPSERTSAMMKISYDPFNYQRRQTFEAENIGGKHVPVVIADLSRVENIAPRELQDIGYTYDPSADKWTIADGAADYVYTGDKSIDFQLPGTLRPIIGSTIWETIQDKEKYYPAHEISKFIQPSCSKSEKINFVFVDVNWAEGNTEHFTRFLELLRKDQTVVLCLSSTAKNAVQSIRRMYNELIDRDIQNPVVNLIDSGEPTEDERLIHFATEGGALFLEGLGDGIFLRNKTGADSDACFLNNAAFGILQATRTRISKTEYISCPSCGRTLFDLQETTARIRAVTNHLKGVKIAIMGCIVNGPGEMADADFGYVGSGPGKITLYRGKEIIKRNVNSDVAVQELIDLLKENNAWVEPQLVIGEKDI